MAIHVSGGRSGWKEDVLCLRTSMKYTVKKATVLFMRWPFWRVLYQVYTMKRGLKKIMVAFQVDFFL